jgi:hypothetical protein
MSNERIIDKNMSIIDLEALLIRYKVSLTEWGKGNTKTLRHLLDEIHLEESSLIICNGKIKRLVSAIGVNVFYQNNGITYKLHEDKQVFFDGRTRKRNMKHSVSEKMVPDENPTITTIRGIKEELGVKINWYELVSTGEESKIRESISYPNLQSEYVIFEYKTRFSEEHFNKDGYIEIQKDKKTYFKWMTHNKI